MACRGFFDAYKTEVSTLRLAVAMNGVIFVPNDDLERERGYGPC